MCYVLGLIFVRHFIAISWVRYSDPVLVKIFETRFLTSFNSYVIGECVSVGNARSTVLHLRDMDRFMDTPVYIIT